MIDDFLLKVKHRKPTLLIALGLLGVFFGTGVLLKPSLMKLDTLKKEKGDLEQKGDLFNDVLRQENKMIEYRKRLPQIAEKATFIDNLNALASQSGLTVLSVTPEEKSVVAVYLEKIAVRIEAEGNYHQLGAFVSAFENLEQFTKIISVDIDTKSSGRDPVILDPGRMSRESVSLSSGYKMSIVVGVFYPTLEVF